MRVAERNENIIGLVLLAPAIRLAARWRHTMPEAIEAWAQSGWMEVDDHVANCKVQVDFGFFEDVERIEERAVPVVGPDREADLRHGECEQQGERGAHFPAVLRVPVGAGEPDHASQEVRARLRGRWVLLLLGCLHDRAGK